MPVAEASAPGGVPYNLRTHIGAWDRGAGSGRRRPARLQSAGTGAFFATDVVVLTGVLTAVGLADPYIPALAIRAAFT